jgi:hypothetical protein
MFDELHRLEISSLNTPNWITEGGVRKKRKQIQLKGLPNFKYCKHITLTIDPANGDPRFSYELGKDRMRRFLANIRKVTGIKFGWAWRLEFQENEYAHWHLIVIYRKKIPKDMLQFFTKWWNLGRVKVQGLTSENFNYLFKYLSKGSEHGFDLKTGLALPSWVLDYQTVRANGRKTAGIRFWQTGGHFYTREKKPNREKSKPQRYSLVPYTLRERYQMLIRKVRFCMRNGYGKVRKSVQFNLSRSYGEFLHRISKTIQEGNATPLDDEHYWKCRINLIFKELQQWQKQKLISIYYSFPNLGMAYISLDL